MKEIITKIFEFEDFSIFLKLFQLHKSHLLLLSDKEDMGIREVTLSSPTTIEGLKANSSTYNLFGMHHNTLNSIIAKRAAHLCQTPVLTLVFLAHQIEDQEVIKTIVNFLNQVMKKDPKNK